MIEFLARFISNIPVWVPFLLCFLVWIGFVSSKEREAPKIIYYLFPLLILVSLVRVSTLPHATIAWSVFVIGTLIGAMVGYRLQGKWLVADLGNRVRVSGEWFTMVTVLAIFLIQFSNGAVGGISPSTASTTWFVALVGLIVSIATGTFLGRAFRVIFAAKHGV